MEINWGIFLPALLLLAYPLDRILPARMKGRTCEYLTDPAVRHRHTWWRWQPELWADAIRIYLGAWFVNFSITATGPDSRNLLLVVTGLSFGGALGCQMITRRKEDSVLAPLGFMLAVPLVLLPVPAALASYVLAVVGMMALRDFSMFFIAGAPAAAVLGYLLGGGVTSSALVAALFALPVLVGSLTRRKLILPVRSRADVERVYTPLR